MPDTPNEVMLTAQRILSMNEQGEHVLATNVPEKHLDVLFDQGIIHADWVTIDGEPTRAVRIADEAEGFVKRWEQDG